MDKEACAARVVLLKQCLKQNIETVAVVCAVEMWKRRLSLLVVSVYADRTGVEKALRQWTAQEERAAVQEMDRRCTGLTDNPQGSLRKLRETVENVF